MRTGFTAIVLSALLGIALNASSALGAQSHVIGDCNAHGKLTRSYSVAELRTTLATMPADVKEYTDCYDVIQHAMLSQLSESKAGGSGGAGGSAGSGSSFLPSWLIVVLVLLGLSGLTLGAVAVRRRNAQS